MAKITTSLSNSLGTIHNNLEGLNEGDFIHLTQVEKDKLNNIENGAEVNVNADWNSISGDSEILNKPTEFTPTSHTHNVSDISGTKLEFNSSLTNGNFLFEGDVIPFEPLDYDLNDFTNVSADPFARTSELTSGITNLSYTPSSTNGIVVSDTGTDATIPTVDFINAGLLTPSEKQLLYNNSATGITKFDGFSINVDTTKYNTGIIEGWFVDNTTNPNTPTKVFKSFPATTANTLTNIATQNVTYIAVDINGVHQQSGVPFEPEVQRDWIPLGVIVHSNRVSINAINNQPVVVISPNNQLSDLMESIGVFNITGNVFSPNGTNLSINKSAGQIFKQGSNFITNTKDPHTTLLPALIAPSNLRYRTQLGAESADTNVVAPNFWDNAGVITTMTGTRWSIQRIYVFQSNLVRIQYGQATYANLAEAIQSIATEAFVVEQNILENGLFRGLLIVRRNATDLTDATRALFIEASKFGSVAGLGSLSTSNLQQAYNNSLTPEITTDSILGAFTLKRGSTVDTDNVFETQNGAGTITSTITGNGALTALTYNGYIPENISNKQNSLAVDGTGVKYPTVDATNAGLSLKENISNKSDSFTVSSSTTYSSTKALVDGLATKQDILSYLEFNSVDKTIWNNGKGDIVSNVSFGEGSLRLNTTGFENTAIGSGVLQNNTTGVRNNGIGSGGLLSNTTGSSNNAMGSGSMRNNISGSENSTVGYNTLFSSSTGSLNVAIGSQTGRYIADKSTSLVTINNSTLIGYRASPLADNQVNQIVIGYDGIGLGSNTTVIGNSSTLRSRIWGSGLFGTSTDNGQGVIQANGNITASPATLSNQVVVKSQLDLKSNIDSPTFTGVPNVPTATAGTNTTQIASTAFVVANSNAAGLLNYSLTNKTVWNSGSGDISTNTSFGRFAMLSNTTGSGNSVYGVSALAGNTIGSNNIGIGASAGYSYTGGFDVTTTNNSIYIGNSTKALGNNQTNQIVIGDSAIGYGSNTATFGNDSITDTFLKGVVNQSKSYTVATLPTGKLGDFTWVTDATAPTYLGVIVGGGAIVTPVFYNGTNWVAH